MAYELKEGTGTIFKNANKQQPNHPDYQGELKIDGKVWKIAGWRKTGESSGRPWELISISVDKRDAGNQRPTRKEVGLDDGDVPF